jgi:hypothetical protein
MRVKPVFKKLWRTSSAKVRYKVQYLDLHDPKYSTYGDYTRGIGSAFQIP